MSNSATALREKYKALINLHPFSVGGAFINNTYYIIPPSITLNEQTYKTNNTTMFMMLTIALALVILCITLIRRRIV